MVLKNWDKVHTSCKNYYKTIKNKLYNVNLKRKIIVSFVVMVAIPILLISFLLFDNLEKYLTHNTIKNHTNELNLEHYKMINNVSIISNISQVVMENEDIIEFITNSHNIENYDFYKLSSNVYNYMSNLQNNNQYISDINIFIENDKINEIWPFIYNNSRIENQKWYTDLLESDEDTSWSLFCTNNDIEVFHYTGQKDGSLVVSLNSKIRDINNKIIGVARVSMKVEDFLPIMINKTLNKYSNVFIYNKKTKEVSGEKKFLEENNNIYDIDEFFQNIEGKFNGGDGSFELENLREEFKILYKKAPIINCYIVDVISLNSLTKEITNIKIYTIIGTIIIILILICVIWFMTDRILKRLYIIIDSLKEVKDGNFNSSIPVYGEDEIGLLAHNFRRLMEKINSLIRESVRKEMATKEAEVKALKTQIDAHFLYNTLENIKMIAEVEGNYTVSDSLVTLGDLVRYNTKWNNEYVMLNEEIMHTRNYISLMALRYDYNINLNICIDENLEGTSILKMIIQPLVENSVKHGISKILNSREGNIDINIKSNKDFIIVSVSDDGVGMNGEKRILLQHHIQGDININFGLGLRNVYERIRLAYGDKAHIYITSEESKGTKIALKIPKI